ncbi:hypothetical protein ACLB2K_058379 [Fragaria x ananassa]
MILSVDEEVEVELTRLEAREGAADPGVDVGGVVVVEDEGEAEGFDGRVGAEDESAVDELGESVAGDGEGLGVVVGPEEVVGEVEAGETGPEGSPLAGDERGADGL